MVKNHRHGAIGHVKHGGGELVHVHASTQPAHALEAAAPALAAAAAAAAAQAPALAAASVASPTEGKPRHGDKRPRIEESSAVLGETPLGACLKNEAVTCTTTAAGSEGLTPGGGTVSVNGTTFQEIRSGASFSAAVDPHGERASDAHRIIVQLVLASEMTGLDLTGNALDPEDCKALAAALARTTCRLATLNMRRVGMGPGAAAAFGAALRTNASLTSLDLQRNGLGWAGGRACGDALAVNASLVRLDVSLNDIGPEGGRAFAEALKTNRSLTALQMVRCGLGPDGGRALGEALARNTTLASLDVTQNDFGVSGGIAFGKALAVNRSLTSLNMRFNRIGFGLERSLHVFAQSLAVNASLRWLDLAQNELGALGGCAFGEALKANQALQFLNMERNELGEEGGYPVAKALVSNASLTSLDMSHNELGRAGGAFAEALTVSSSLRSLNLSKNNLGPAEGRTLGEALKVSACTHLHLQCNRLQSGAVQIADALAHNDSLLRLDLSANELGGEGARAFGEALMQNETLVSIGLAGNGLEDGASLGAALAMHPSLAEADLSDNNITLIPIGSQLELGLKSCLSIDLSNNPLSSPPLGRRAVPEELQAYLRLLASESTAVTRIRLMTLGFGGVGKSTFCAAATRQLDEMAHFQGSLTPLEAWDTAMMASWARCLGTEWSPAAAAVLEANGVRGKDLQALVVRTGGAEGLVVGDHAPSKVLEQMVGEAMTEPQRRKLAQAIGALVFKGYLSTVGAVKVEGLIPLRCAHGGRRECSLVDFAGQMEYLVSHQLLLTTMHALCIVIKPAPAFATPSDPHGASRRHPESWRYWLKYLRALSMRPAGSLLLAVSQLDRVAGSAAEVAESAFLAEFAQLRRELGDGLGEAPLRLDYSPSAAEASMAAVRQRLSGAAEAVAKDWWVPESYEGLAELVRRLLREKKEARELPILSRARLRSELRTEAASSLNAMADDPQLLKRGVEYLEAVGDVMADERLDVLLLDPVDWFASFLAHFIRDDGNRPAEVVRGAVRVEDIVAALRHEYASPAEQVPEVMRLMCRLELCIPHVEVAPAETAFLFPCLLPPASAQELARDWPSVRTASAPTAATAPPVIRGHRFRACLGFLPPGLFPGLVARLVRLNGRLPPGDLKDCTHSSRLWSDAAVVVFREARVLLRVDLVAATLDLVAAAPADEHHFVGAAKGQASVTRWLAHLIRQYLCTYEQIDWEEAWLCPSPKCHGLEKTGSNWDPLGSFGVYAGTEFALEPVKGKARRGEHVCNREGCWHQLGLGHSLEPMRLRHGEQQVCGGCQQQPRFALRAGAQFGWGHRAEAQQLLRGLGMGGGGGALPGSQWVSSS